MWSNCLGYVKKINLIMTHVYREDNECVDSLKNVGRSLKCTHVLSNMSHFSQSNVVKNKLELSSFRFKFN